MAKEKGYLFAGEEVALVVRPHPIVLLKPSMAPLAAVALFGAVGNRFTLAILLLVLARFGWDAGQWWVDRYTLTTERIISTSGILSKRVISMPLAKITDLTYERSLAGRLMGYGSLGLESAGQVGLERIEHLPEPDHFYRAVMSLALGPRPTARAAAHEEAEAAASPVPDPPPIPVPPMLDLRGTPSGAGTNPDGDPDTAQIPIIRTSED